MAPLAGPDGIVPMQMPHPPFTYPPPKGPENFNGLPVGTYQPFAGIHPPQIPAAPPTYETIGDLSAEKGVFPSQVTGPGPKPQASAKPAAGPPDSFDNFVLPELPSVPDTLPTASGSANHSAS
uniref:Uncharacterized protein n=1 Tax=Sphenodon punctatus TaxID=8508 RepID=A0A8D0L3Y8_SPHPU